LSRFASFKNVIKSGFAALSIKLRLLAALRRAPATGGSLWQATIHPTIRVIGVIRGKMKKSSRAVRIAAKSTPIPETCAAANN